MTGDVFINEAINDAFSIYTKCRKDFKDPMEEKTSLDYNSFLCSIVRMLVLVYGEEIVSAYSDKNTEEFNKTLMKYGMSEKDIEDFEVLVQRYYAMDRKQIGKTFRKKNKFFNVVQKYLIDMLVKKNIAESVPKEVVEGFESLLFTANNPDFYRASTALAEAFNPNQIGDYFEKQSFTGE